MRQPDHDEQGDHEPGDDNMFNWRRLTGTPDSGSRTARHTDADADTERADAAADEKAHLVNQRLAAEVVEAQVRAGGASSGRPTCVASPPGAKNPRPEGLIQESLTG